MTVSSQNRCSARPRCRSLAASLPGMRARQLIEEMRRDNDRRDREAQKRDRESDKRIRESQERIEALRQESREWREDWRRFREEREERMRKHDEEHRRLMGEIERQIQDQRLGFNVTYGALADLAAEIRSWRDEGGPSAAA